MICMFNIVCFSGEECGILLIIFICTCSVGHWFLYLSLVAVYCISFSFPCICVDKFNTLNILSIEGLVYHTDDERFWMHTIGNEITLDPRLNTWQRLAVRNDKFIAIDRVGNQEENNDLMVFTLEIIA